MVTLNVVTALVPLLLVALCTRAGVRAVVVMAIACVPTSLLASAALPVKVRFGPSTLLTIDNTAAAVFVVAS